MIRVAVVMWLAVWIAPAWQAAGVLIPGIVREPVRDHWWFMENDPSYKQYWQPVPGDMATPQESKPS